MVRIDSHCAEMALEPLAVDMLCQYVCGVLLAGHFGENNVSGTQALLHPQVRGVKMSNLPEPSASADADGRCGVGPHLQSQAYSQVLCDALQPEAVASAAADASELCLCARKSHGRLRLGKMLDEMSPSHGCEAGR